MQREERTEVLVVGAGPVGMLTALLLSEAGIQVRIIDHEFRTASRTYACALHTRTLKLLDRLGLSSEVMQLGRRVGQVALYEGEVRRAEAKLSQLPVDFPFVLVLPQSAFENLLEQRLRKDGKVRLEWNHRLSGLRTERDGVVAAIEKLGVSAKGYIVPEMAWSVEKTEETRAAYVVGADGPNSFVAKFLGLSYEAVGEPEFYAVYEFQSDWAFGDELRIALDKRTSSILWPLPGNKFRWSFQLLQEHLREFPEKERSPLIIDDPRLERANREFVQKLVQERAPWFKGSIQTIDWSTDVEFEHRLAKRFGNQHCWLAGDAAHQTGPGGMQSMNRGLVEAEKLADALTSVLNGKAPLDRLETYNQECREEWRRLLGLSGAITTRPKTDVWIKQQSARILPCLPASGEDLSQLLNQLELDLA
jgi:2-polyprenyl-6-methoxyphenol hydroxylase-like FAD-dependent oxidoreductase